MSNKSEATWHPNSGPEVPHADLIARLRGIAADSYELDGATIAAAADALAALGDTVPASTLGKVVTSYEEALREAWAERDALQRGLVAGTERAEAAEAERDAVAALIHRTVERMGSVPFGGQEYGPTTFYVRTIYDMLKSAPAVSLALHDAEVLHTAADAPFVERDQDGYMPGYCECGHIDEGVVRQSLHARAAAIRENN